MCAFLKNINMSTLVSLTKENDKKHNCGYAWSAEGMVIYSTLYGAVTEQIAK